MGEPNAKTERDAEQLLHRRLRRAGLAVMLAAEAFTLVVRGVRGAGGNSCRTAESDAAAGAPAGAALDADASAAIVDTPGGVPTPTPAEPAPQTKPAARRRNRRGLLPGQECSACGVPGIAYRTSPNDRSRRFRCRTCVEPDPLKPGATRRKTWKGRLTYAREHDRPPVAAGGEDV